MVFIIGTDFPGTPVVENPPSNAGDTGSSLRSHMLQLLSPRGTIQEKSTCHNKDPACCN